MTDKQQEAWDEVLKWPRRLSVAMLVFTFILGVAVCKWLWNEHLVLLWLGKILLICWVPLEVIGFQFLLRELLIKLKVIDRCMY